MTTRRPPRGQCYAEGCDARATVAGLCAACAAQARRWAPAPAPTREFVLGPVENDDEAPLGLVEEVSDDAFADFVAEVVEAANSAPDSSDSSSDTN